MAVPLARSMPSHARSEAPGFAEVDVDTCYWSKELPDLGLVMDANFPFRVYVLACEPRKWGEAKTVYVGIANRSQIGRRIRTDAGQGPSAPHFCQTHAPQYVMGIFPAACRAVEACIFYALARTRSEKSLACGGLGGWTQTSTQLSALAKLNLERERRMVSGSCLKCASEAPGHATRNCQREAYTFVTCACCMAQNRISDRGIVLGVVRPRDETVAESRVAKPRVGSPAAPASAPVVAPAIRAEISPRTLRADRPPQATSDFLQVRICGTEYTTLAWFLGKVNPTPREVRMALEHGKSHAAVMIDGQASSLAAAGFATRCPEIPAELLPAGTGVLPSYFVNTLAKTSKKRNYVKVKAAPAQLTGTRNVYFRTRDLKLMN